MKRKWIYIEKEYVYKCKICEIKRIKLRDLKHHISITHTKWQKREYERSRIKFYYWNYCKNKPISYFLGLIVNIENLFY